MFAIFDIDSKRMIGWAEVRVNTDNPKQLIIEIDEAELNSVDPEWKDRYHETIAIDILDASAIYRTEHGNLTIRSDLVRLRRAV